MTVEPLLGSMRPVEAGDIEKKNDTNLVESEKQGGKKLNWNYERK